MSKIRRSRGFTVLEMTAVVAVIGILAMIAWFFLGQNGDKANDELVKENLSQYQKAAWSYATAGGEDAYSLATVSDIVGDAAGAGVEPCVAADQCSEVSGKISMGTSADGKVLALAMRSRSGNCAFLVATGGRVNHIRVSNGVPEGECKASNAIPSEDLPYNKPPVTGNPIEGRPVIGPPPDGTTNPTPGGGGGGGGGTGDDAPEMVSTPKLPNGASVGGSGAATGIGVLRSGDLVVGVTGGSDASPSGSFVKVSEAADGKYTTETIATSGNLPVESLAVHPQTGEVYFSLDAGSTSQLWKADRNMENLTRVSTGLPSRGCATGSVLAGGTARVKDFQHLEFDDAGFLWALDNACGKLVRFDRATKSITNSYDMPSTYNTVAARSEEFCSEDRVGSPSYPYCLGADNAAGMVAQAGSVYLAWTHGPGVYDARFDMATGSSSQGTARPTTPRSLIEYTRTLALWTSWATQEILVYDTSKVGTGVGALQVWSGVAAFPTNVPTDQLDDPITLPTQVDGNRDTAARFTAPGKGVYDSVRGSLWLADQQTVQQVWSSTGRCPALSTYLDVINCSLKAFPAPFGVGLNPGTIDGQSWTLRRVNP